MNIALCRVEADYLLIVQSLQRHGINLSSATKLDNRLSNQELSDFQEKIQLLSSVVEGLRAEMEHVNFADAIPDVHERESLLDQVNRALARICSELANLFNSYQCYTSETNSNNAVKQKQML